MTAHSNPLAEQPDPRAAALQGGCEALRITRTSSSHSSVLLQHPHPPPSLGIAAKGKMCLAEVDASPAELSAQGLSLHTQQRKSLLETQMDTQAVSSSTELSAEMGRTPHSTHTRSHWEPSLHRSLSLTKRQKEAGARIPLNISVPPVNTSQRPCWRCTTEPMQLQTSQGPGLPGPHSSHTAWMRSLGLTS